MPIDLDLLAGRVSQQPQDRPQLDPNLMAQAKQDAQRWAEEDKRERLAIRDSYIRDLISPIASVRFAGQRKALKEVKDPTFRKWLLEDVSMYGHALSSLDRQERSEAGYFGRAAIDLQKAGRTVGGSISRTGRSFARIPSSLFGKGKSKEDVAFERALESSSYGDGPASSLWSSNIDTSTVVGKIARGAEFVKEGVAAIAPDMIPSTAALKIGGRGLSAVFWASRQFSDSYEDLKEMGASDTQARSIGAAIAGGTGMIEQFNPDPLNLVKTKGLIRDAIRLASKKAQRITARVGGRKALAHPLTKRAVGQATGAVARAASEVGEEGVQAAYDEAMKFNLAARDQDIEYRDVADIGRNAWAAMIEAGPGVAALGGGGGVVSFGQDVSRFKAKATGLKQSKIETDIIRFAQSGETPSRKQWAKWGGLAEEGFSMKNRKAGVIAIAGELQQVARVRTVIEGHTPTEQQWKDWGFDPEDGLTPEARKGFLFDKFKEGYKEEQSAKQSKQRAEEELRQRDDVIAEQVSALKTQETLQKPSDEQIGMDRPLLPSEAAEGLPEAAQFAEGLSGAAQPSVSVDIRPSVAPERQESPDTPVITPEAPTGTPTAISEDLKRAEATEITETAEEKIKREADEAERAARPALEASGFGPGGGRILGERERSDEIGGEMPKFRDEVEADFAASDTSLDVAEKIKEIAKDAKSDFAKAVTRSQMHLPDNAENAAFNELFRIQKEVTGRAKESTVQTVGAIVSDLGPKQYDLFSRVIILRNLEASVKAKQPLRFKFQSLGEVQADLAKLEAIVEKTPAVKKALATRKTIVTALVGQLVDAELLPEEAKKSADTYYHQQVMLYAKVGRLTGASSRVFTSAGKKKGFQKKRIEVKEGKSKTLGSEFNYNTNYLEADIAWMTDAKAALETKKIYSKLMSLADIRSDLEKEAKLMPGKVAWRDLAAKKDGYVTFRAPPGSVFSGAVTIQDQITEQIVRETLEQGGVATDKNYSVVMDGTKGREVVIPANLARQLSEQQRPQSKGIRRAVELAQQGWKLNILFRPNNVLAYLARNVTGDLDVSLAVDPGMRKFAKQAWKELRKHHGKSLSSTKLLDSARAHAVIGSGRTSQEYESIDNIDLFRRLNRKGLGVKTLATPVMAYYEFIRKHNAFREDVLRYAAFLSAREQLTAGRVKHYGGSKKEVVDAIHKDLGVDAAAAHMSRNLLGDYGNLTVAGEWVRRNLIPFWAFQEINLKRMPRIFINAIKAGQEIDSKSPVIKVAASTLLATRMAWMQGAVWVWNNLVMADDDEEYDTGLSEYDQANLAVRMGRNDDGSERIFRNVGALGDFLEWFGINEALISLPGVINDQISASDLILQMGLSAPEKVIGSLRPEFTSGYSILTEQSLFPDVFNPRAIRRGEAVAQMFGATDEWKAVRGMTLGKGERARPHYFQRFMFGVSDPRQVALSSMYTLRNRFLKKKGIVDKAIYPISKYKEARDAAKSGNYEAFSEWRQSFIKAAKPGRAERNFKSFLNRMDPISRLSRGDRREFEREFLTDEQRGQLEVSRVYSGELGDLLWTWWVADRNEENQKKD